MVHDFTQAICFGSCRWLKPSEQLLQEICHQRILQEFVSCGRRFCQMSCFNEQLPLWGSRTSFHKHSSRRYLNFYCQLLFPLFADKQECSGWTILLWCTLCFCEDFCFLQTSCTLLWGFFLQADWIPDLQSAAVEHGSMPWCIQDIRITWRIENEKRKSQKLQRQWWGRKGTV